MKTTITVEWLPIHILVGGVIFSIYGLGGVFLGDLRWVYAIVFLIGLMMATSRRLVRIDSKNNKISDFYWVLGIKVQDETYSYDKISSIALTSGLYTQQYGMYVRRHISGTIYKLYLELEGMESHYVGQSKSEERAREKAAKLAEDLGIEVINLVKE